MTETWVVCMTLHAVEDCECFSVFDVKTVVVESGDEKGALKSALELAQSSGLSEEYSLEAFRLEELKEITDVAGCTPAW